MQVVIYMLKVEKILYGQKVLLKKYSYREVGPDFNLKVVQKHLQQVLCKFLKVMVLYMLEDMHDWYYKVGNNPVQLVATELLNEVLREAGLR